MKFAGDLRLCARQQVVNYTAHPVFQLRRFVRRMQISIH